MFTTIRKHQRWLMTVIAVLTIIAFAWLYNTTNMEQVGTNIVARIYGRDVMQVEVERAARSYQLALALGQFDLVEGLAGRSRSEEEMLSNFVWNLMVLRHEARALQAEPGDQAVVDRMKTLPAFQTDGQFDPKKYADFLQNQLAPRGLSEAQLEEVVRDALRLSAVQRLVESPAVLLPDDLAPALERLKPMDLLVADFPLDLNAATAQVTDEAVNAAFASRKDSLQKPEERSLRFVLFELPEASTALQGKERLEALQKLADSANTVAQALADNGPAALDGAAAAQQRQVLTTPLFQADGRSAGLIEENAQQVISAASRLAFRLQPGSSSFDIVQVGDGYAVVVLDKVEPARPLTLEEARPQLREELARAAAEQALAEKARKARESMSAALASGKAPREAAAAAGLTLREVPGVSLFDPAATPEQQRLGMAAMEVATGALGAFTPGPEGGVLVFVERREDPDPAAAAARRPQIERSLLEGRRQLLYVQWLNQARQDARLQMLRPMS